MAKKGTKTVANEITTEISVADVMADVTDNKAIANDEPGTVTEPVAVEPTAYKTVIATVLGYDKHSKKLAVNIDGYGIMLANVQDYNDTDTYIVKYTGTIGEADCKIISDVC